MDHSEALSPARADHNRQSLQRARKLAHLLDNAFRVPGTQWRIGWDSLIGIIPGVGDVLTTGVSLWIVSEAKRLGAPGSLQLRMVWKLLLDMVFGSVPLIGDVFDAGYKANVRNVQLLEDWLHKNGHL